MRKLLKKLRINKISFCLNSNPSTGLEFLVKKSEDGEDLAEVIVAVNEFIEGDLSAAELFKAVDAEGLEEIKKALETLKTYKKDMPDDAEVALETLAKWAAKGVAGAGNYGYPKKEEEAEVKKSVPTWDSFKLPGEDSEPIRIELADEEDPDEEGEIDDPYMAQLIKLDKRLAKMEEPEKKDKWGSFEIVGGHIISKANIDKVLRIEKKEAPVKKEEPSRGQKTGLEGHSVDYYKSEPEDKWSSWIL